MLQLPEQPSSYLRSLASVDEAYEQCRQLMEHFTKSFYLATLLFPAEKRRAIWAIYVWCRRTDELVDGLNGKLATDDTLDQWETRLEKIFAGYPEDDFDVALVDTVERFPIDIQPFRDMIAGQRMDLYRSRYETFDELYLYCYRVASTVGLMSTDVMGLAEPDTSVPWYRPESSYSPLDDAIALGVAKQLTNILRDVGEDARRGRIYLPLEDLERFGYTEDDLFKGVNDDRWKALMKFQIDRARQFYTQAERGIGSLNQDARWPVWSALMLYSRILNAIENNDYDNFNRRAYVPGMRKMSLLPISWLRARVL